MLIVGLTGSVGMGKSTVAKYLRTQGVPVIDADAIVHQLYEGAAVPLIESAFPGTTQSGKVDRGRLSAELVAAPKRFGELEAIIHPLVRAEERIFLQTEADRGTPIVVLEIPLLFETGADKLVDATIVVSAPKEIQRQRVLEREGFTPEKLDKLLERQTPDAQKRALADFIVETGGELEHSHDQLDAILAQLKDWKGDAYTRWWA